MVGWSERGSDVVVFIYISIYKIGDRGVEVLESSAVVGAA